MKYKYIHFVKVADKAKTAVWECRNNRSSDGLGTVEWYGPWRQYCFCPEVATVFNTSCLADIQDFLDKVNRERKRRRTKP